MGYQGFYEILMIIPISSKNLGGYRIMKHTVQPKFKFKSVNKSVEIVYFLGRKWASLRFGTINFLYAVQPITK